MTPAFCEDGSIRMINKIVVLMSCFLVSMVIFCAQQSTARGENLEKTEWVVLVSQQPEALGADVIVNGIHIGKLLSPDNSEYSNAGPHIRLKLKLGVYVFRVESSHFIPFEKQYTINERLPEPGITLGDQLIIVKMFKK